MALKGSSLILRLHLQSSDIPSPDDSSIRRKKLFKLEADGGVQKKKKKIIHLNIVGQLRLARPLSFEKDIESRHYY